MRVAGPAGCSSRCGCGPKRRALRSPGTPRAGSPTGSCCTACVRRDNYRLLSRHHRYVRAHDRPATSHRPSHRRCGSGRRFLHAHVAVQRAIEPVAVERVASALFSESAAQYAAREEQRSTPPRFPVHGGPSANYILPCVPAFTPCHRGVRFALDGRTSLGYSHLMAIKASALRENIYRILDEVLETGVPIEIERRGKILQISTTETRSKLDNLRPRPYLLTNPEELVHLDWSEEWRP